MEQTAVGETPEARDPFVPAVVVLEVFPLHCPVPLSVDERPRREHPDVLFGVAVADHHAAAVRARASSMSLVALDQCARSSAVSCSEAKMASNASRSLIGVPSPATRRPARFRSDRAPRTLPRFADAPSQPCDAAGGPRRGEGRFRPRRSRMKVALPSLSCPLHVRDDTLELVPVHKMPFRGPFLELSPLDPAGPGAPDRTGGGFERLACF